MCRAALLADWLPTVSAQVAAGELTWMIQREDQGPHTHLPDAAGNVPNADALIIMDLARHKRLAGAEIRAADIPGWSALVAAARRVEAWRVRSFVRRGPVREDPVRDGPARGVSIAPTALTMVSFVSRRADLDHDQFVTHWTRRHTPLALRHHTGLSGYRQHVVDEALTPGGASIDGIAELAFAELADYEQRYYDSDAGKQVIRDDVARFIEPVPVRLTTLMERPDLVGGDPAADRRGAR